MVGFSPLGAVAVSIAVGVVVVFVNSISDPIPVVPEGDALLRGEGGVCCE
jgi:hypothetical protein